jgi:transketolase
MAEHQNKPISRRGGIDFARVKLVRTPQGTGNRELTGTAPCTVLTPGKMPAMLANGEGRTMPNDIDRLCINTIRTLAMDAVERADSGHPGAPMGLAPAAYVLWQRHITHNPKAPAWPNRDRFVLSNGHASMLQYAMLHLTGYESMTLEQIKNFRQWGSITPGHPEVDLTPGVETTTGPLGQGFANAVGMALAEAKLREEFDGMIDHHTWGMCSDGDLMEGISHEAASLAGHLGLGRLNLIYGDNDITIDGGTNLSFTEDVEQRFAAYGWETLHVTTEQDLDAIDGALEVARSQTDAPTLIALETTIGYGSPSKADTSAAHGAPLGPDEIERTKEALDWPYDEPFVVPDEVREAMDATEAGEHAHAQWVQQMNDYAESHPEDHAELKRRLGGLLPDDWADDLPSYDPSDGPLATRRANGDTVEVLYERLPELTGGSADLAGSNKTLHEDFGVIDVDDHTGQNMHFGVREHGMCGIANGMNLHGGVRGFGATFLIFSDYMRPSLRLSALMDQPTVMVFTHDSIGLGEDGPTHQPIEHLMSLRAMPNMAVFRPGDANEVGPCWRAAIERQSGPSSLVFTRQGVPVMDRTDLTEIGDASRGGYVLADAPSGDPDLLLFATGSEVPIALDAWRQLVERDIEARVVSLPCWELFDDQDASYRNQIAPDAVDRRMAIEAGASLGWERWVGRHGVTVGIDQFGASAPYQTNYDKHGLTADDVVRRAIDYIQTD